MKLKQLCMQQQLTTKENNANIFKTGANNAMPLANNMTKLHSKIDLKLANPFSKTLSI